MLCIIIENQNIISTQRDRNAKAQFKDKTNYEFQRYQNTCMRTCVVTHHESNYNNAKQVRQTINTLNESIIDENITAVLSFS